MVMITYVFVCLRYVLTQSVSHLRIFLDKLFVLACFRLNEKKEIMFPFTKKVTSKILIIIVQFLCFHVTVKPLTQRAFPCAKLTMGMLVQGVKYVQS